MFAHFLRVLAKGKPENVQLAKLWDDLDTAAICLDELPDGELTLVWLTTTQWYLSGGWEQVRQAAYGPWQAQLDRQYDGVWDAHVAAIKARWPKPDTPETV